MVLKTIVQAVGVFIFAVVSGLAIAFVGAVPWVWLADLNLKFHPEYPWSACVTLIFLAAGISWLAGVGPPVATQAFRRRHLRFWRPEPGAWAGSRGSTNLLIMGLIAGIYTLGIVAMPRAPAPPDVSAFPTKVSLLTTMLMGALISGGVEEVAFRGYMQSQLERFGAAFAVLVTTAIFTASHVTHGMHFFLGLMPWYIVLSLLWCTLALRTGSILPGMALHITGDGLIDFFVNLRGDVSLIL